MALHEKKCSIRKNKFLIALNLILNSTYFTFNGLIYKQCFGSLTGSPLSPILADIVLQDFKEEALRRLNIDIPFYPTTDMLTT